MIVENASWNLFFGTMNLSVEKIIWAVPQLVKYFKRKDGTILACGYLI